MRSREILGILVGTALAVLVPGCPASSSNETAKAPTLELPINEAPSVPVQITARESPPSLAG